MNYLYGLLGGLLWWSSCQTDATSTPFPKEKDISDYPATTLLATTAETANWETNILYCPTLLLAWEGVRETLPSPVLIAADQEALEALDGSQGHIGALEEGEYDRTIRILEQGINVQVSFASQLLLKEPLEDNPIPLSFAGRSVACFGGTGADEAVTTQVTVLFYEDEDEFAFALTPEDSSQQLLFYHSRDHGRRSLEALYEALIRKMARYARQPPNKNEVWRADDLVAIPNLSFNISKSYTDLLGSRLSAQGTPYTITAARQRLALALNKMGALLESEAEMEWVTEAVQELPQARLPRRLVLDAAFLLVAKKVKAANPYLLAWINNTELMQAAD